MSFQAMAWASGTKEKPITWGGPSARAAIYAITNHANDDWFCYAKQETLARESEQSADSIQRRIQEFVDLGRVRRIKLKRFGRRTFDFLILQPSQYFTAPIEEIEPFIPRGCDIMVETDAAAGCGSVETQDSVTDQVDSEVHAAADCGSVSDATLPQPALDAAALVRQQEPFLEPKIPSQTLPESSYESEKGQARKEAAADSGLQAFIERFRSIYPLPCSKPEAFAEDAAALSEGERAQCLHGAAGAAEYLRKSPKAKGVLGPNRFIKSSAVWAEFSRFAPAEKAPPPPRVFVVEGSEEWRARLVISTVAGVRMPEPKPNENAVIGADFLGHLPPAGLALAQFTNGLGALTISDWILLDKDQRKGQIAAWRERVLECTGHHIELQSYDLGGTTQSTFNGKTYELPRRMIGLRVPSQWPPAKVAKHATGTLATEEELDEFAHNTS